MEHMAQVTWPPVDILCKLHLMIVLQTAYHGNPPGRPVLEPMSTPGLAEATYDVTHMSTINMRP